MISQLLHKTTALLLTILLLANNLNNIIIVTDFVVNQDFIAKTLCIQKEEQKGCMGKCYLKKQLEEASTQDEKQPLQIQNRIELSLFILADKDLSVKTKSSFQFNKKNLFFYNKGLTPFQIVFEITHPPEKSA
ncbi:hypothetical protein [Winogradskyella alexanderae]|uniref:Transmembrane protein n=1 Tax=Winogradskyella alexanderae TaxID=2877123 RepID=A0ABS7XM31_9FLAO|nr:hypothetical protein [Winogradskyella alexanderae]MCA0131028.1 hypothetical protein [Winogradskyella alexanderae]